MGVGDAVHGVCRRGALSGALVFDAGRTAARARLRPAAVAAVEKVGVRNMITINKKAFLRIPSRQYWMIGFISAVLFLIVLPIRAEERKSLHDHVPPAIQALHLQSVGSLPATNELHLAIGVLPRDPAGLDKFLADIYDPASPNYRHFLTPEGFAARFSAAEADYAAVKNFALTNSLKITRESANRLLLDVSGPPVAVEKAFHIKLEKYRHPTEAREFFAPDAEPSVDAQLKVADVQGLTDFFRPHSNLRKLDAKDITANYGSAPDGSGAFFGNDFRNAYAPGTGLTGVGQMVGLFALDGYYPKDITNYAQRAGGGRINIQVQPVLIGSANWSIGADNTEVALDIEMAMAMAPGLSKILVFEGRLSAWPNSILSAMADSNLVKNLSSSWSWHGGPATTTDALFQCMAANGQSFFNASGDRDAFTLGASSPNGVDNPATFGAPGSSPYITQVGGTTLTMSGTGTSYFSETVWNAGNGFGSSGGVSSYYSIPSWQTGISMAANLGSTTQRNIPDVALTADQVYVCSDNGSSNVTAGTSCAAPLWAGFMALVNQQIVINTGLADNSVGFINPAIYAIGKELNPTYSYSSCFHDITSGNNFWPGSPANYPAVVSYDLCTGWGTPNGQNLINALAAKPMFVPFSGLITRSDNAAGIDGVTVTFVPSGGTGAATTSGGGFFTYALSNGWSGTVAPSLGGWAFSPPATTFSSPITAATANVNFYGQRLLSKAVNPTPANGAANIPLTAVMSWANGGGASSYNVNFNGQPKGTVVSHSYTPDYLTELTTYSWRVDANDAWGTVTGDTWTFTTAALPVITVNGNLAFGYVMTGQVATCSMTIRNLGHAALNVSSISYPAGFSGAWLGVVSPGQSTNVTISFKPTGVQSYGGTITIISDASNTNNVIPCSGTGTSGTLMPVWTFTGGADGQTPYSSLIQADDGALYGMTTAGGTNNKGTIFRITTTGVITPLWSFTGGADGSPAWNGLIQANDGALYGTAWNGGTNGNNGAIFRITTAGILTPLWSFTGGADGALPCGSLVQGSDGALYGMTAGGGTNGNNGTVFRITTGGILTPLYSFAGGADGKYPWAGLILGSDGAFYGTTQGDGGGTNRLGTIFRITTNGMKTNLWVFTGGVDGAMPRGVGLVQADDGAFYGTTRSGGTKGWGTIFKVTTNGVLTPIYSFTNGPSSGSNPQAGLVQASDGVLYGTTVQGGLATAGTLFKLTTNGTFNTVWSFNVSPDGAEPGAGLVQASDGALYGTTIGGGTNGFGTIFRLTIGVQPRFIVRVVANPTSAGTVTGGGIYSAGTNISLSATSATSWVFTGWNDGNAQNPRTITVPLTNVTYTANFAPIPPILSASHSGASILLKWPTNVPGFTLWWTTNLASASWTSNSSSATVVNGTNVVTNSISGSSKFYRLKN